MAVQWLSFHPPIPRPTSVTLRSESPIFYVQYRLSRFETRPQHRGRIAEHGGKPRACTLPARLITSLHTQPGAENSKQHAGKQPKIEIKPKLRIPSETVAKCWTAFCWLTSEMQYLCGCVLGGVQKRRRGGTRE